MRIYLVQHGKAGDRGEDGKRHLTEEGKVETSRVASHMKKTGLELEKIIHSGKVRARETAEIFGGELSVKKVDSTEGMNPLDDPKEFIQGIKKGNIMYVGHLPHIEKIISHLITGSSSETLVEVRYSGVICLEKTHDDWKVAWYITPELTVDD
ncbi:phosphohistidine phosphatase SixA [Propionigenium maris DSM 9537]|uniref:Phosphohistidine phosphatase SixA n=1 Tax=Propionigenium maris DSM 9537 TaxID=1123000 RepID=A0A9W6GK22_9FUSO|nr:phosphohistidine phosphatase SixA [Propionigenium maris]GLI55708.1 phosphohistidine phosphatase SixA [Propionigenium maris DSM 9537]